MHKYLTTGAATMTTQGGLRKLVVQVNAALTGTLTCADGIGTFAVITNPTVGSRYEYWDLVGAVTVTTNATCDVCCSGDGSHGPK